MSVTAYTPTYNQTPELLRRAIRSSLAQPGVTQVLVVNDGGPSIESWIADTFRLPGDLARIDLVEHAENRGPWGIWWDSLSLVTGAWMLRVPSDDYSLPGRAERLLAAAAATGAGAIYHDYLWVDEIAGTTEERRLMGREHERIASDCPFPCSATMVSTDLYLAAGMPPPDAGHAHDWWTAWAVGRRARWTHHPETLCAISYCAHGLSATRDPQEFHRDRVAVTKHIRREELKGR